MFKAKQLGKRKHTDSKPQNGTAIKGSNLAEVGRDVSNRRAAPQAGELNKEQRPTMTLKGLFSF